MVNTILYHSVFTPIFLDLRKCIYRQRIEVKFNRIIEINILFLYDIFTLEMTEIPISGYIFFSILRSFKINVYIKERKQYPTQRVPCLRL